MIPNPSALPTLDTDKFKQAFQHELQGIAQWWATHSIDSLNGGFIGKIAFAHKPCPGAHKSVVQNARILWFFSETARINTEGNISGNKKYLALAEYAYQYFSNHFIDRDYGGAFWTLNANGHISNDRKQIYAQAFCIYALTTYHQLTGSSAAIALAQTCFELIETHGRDHKHGGYLEAFGRQWQAIDDMRLSNKDLNAPKTMNTHLHVLEAYTRLYAVAPGEALRAAIIECLSCFDRYIVHAEEPYLRMFMTMDWQDVSTLRSYGHDIEASWLIWEALCVLEDEVLKAAWKPKLIGLARYCMNNAIGDHGELFDGLHLHKQEIIKERVWWVQAEALVGFLNAYVITGDTDFYRSATGIWGFIERYQKDPVHGEWLWFSSLDKPCTESKVGPWKGPYHNGRAMIEAIKRLDSIRTNNISAQR